MTAREYNDIQAILAFSDKTPADWSEYKAAHLVAMLTDEVGNQLLQPGDEQSILDGMGPLVFEELVEACMTHLSVGASPVEDAKKNSAAMPSE